MKHKNILRILGITVILALLLIPAGAVLGAATNTISLMSLSSTVPISSARVGDSFRIDGQITPYSDDTVISFYLTNAVIAPGLTSYITVQPTYHFLGAVDLFAIAGNANGDFDAVTVTVPAVMTTGLTDVAVTSGTYYIYAAKVVPTTGAEWIVCAAPLVITSPTLDAFSPASGPPGTEITITGTNFTPNTALSFKLDGTTPLAITAGTDTLTRVGGIFITRVTLPTAATAGAHTVNVYLGSSTTSIASGTFTVTASAAITLVPPSGAPGSTVVVTGSAYPISAPLVFQWDGTAVTPAAGTNTVTTTTGAFNSIITVPAAATNGAHIITATAGTTTLTATFTVAGATEPTVPPTTTPPPATTPPTTTPPPTGTPNETPTGDTTIDFLTPVDTAGGPANLFGTSFTPGGTVVFKYDGVQVATATATSKGIVSVTFTLPASVHGEHQIVATDGINTGVLSFTIESTAPGVPKPLAPLMGAKVKTPILFNWDDVTDPSIPVTYDLQVATDPNFIAGSIVIDKTKLTTSEYTLTELEAASLSNSAINYYWRERGVDGAQNASAWTGAGSFTVSQPFKFAGWPMYLTMAGIAVVAFLIGLLLGRRTAFSY